MRNLSKAKAEALRVSRANPGVVAWVYRVLDGPNRGRFWVRCENVARRELGGAVVEYVAAYQDGRVIEEVIAR
jgi:hypothetical protein